jgi:flagellar biosynthesis protein FliR
MDAAPLVAWLLASLRVLPSALLVPVGGVGAWSLPLRVVMALALAAGAFASPAPIDGAPWPLLCARELAAGGVLALVFATPMLALDHAAALLSASDARAEPAGRLVRWAGAAAFLAARGHHGALRVLASSWELVPPGAPRRDGAWVDACVRATGDALAGGLVIASAGLVALAVVELSTALVSRLASPFSRDASAPLRGLAVVAAVAVSLRVCVEVVIELAGRAMSLARAL